MTTYVKSIQTDFAGIVPYIDELIDQVLAIPSLAAKYDTFLNSGDTITVYFTSSLTGGEIAQLDAIFVPGRLEIESYTNYNSQKLFADINGTECELADTVNVQSLTNKTLNDLSNTIFATGLFVDGSPVAVTGSASNEQVLTMVTGGMQFLTSPSPARVLFSTSFRVSNVTDFVSTSSLTPNILTDFVYLDSIPATKAIFVLSRTGGILATSVYSVTITNLAGSTTYASMDIPFASLPTTPTYFTTTFTSTPSDTQVLLANYFVNGIITSLNAYCMIITT